MDTKTQLHKKQKQLSEWSIFFAHIFIVLFAFVGMVRAFFSELIEMITSINIFKGLIEKQWHKVVQNFSGISIKSKFFDSRLN